MIQSTIIVPVQDNDGQPFERRQWDALEARLLALAGGWTRQPESEGAWAGPDGRVHTDRSRLYMLAFGSWRTLGDFIALADWVRVEFRQEAVMVVIAGIPDVLGPGRG